MHESPDTSWFPPGSLLHGNTLWREWQKAEGAGGGGGGRVVLTNIQSAPCTTDYFIHHRVRHYLFMELRSRLVDSFIDCHVLTSLAIPLIMK